MIQRMLLLISILISTGAFAQQDSSLIYFDFDKYTLTPQATQVLNRIIAKSNLYDAVIYGHTDQFGSNEYNNKLSLRRANAVKDYLLNHGLDAGKIKIVQGFGETMPVFNQLDAVSRQANRRVLIVTRYEVEVKDSIILEEKPRVETPVVKVPEAQPQKPSSPVRKPVKEDLITEIIDSSTRVGDNIILQNINFYGGRHVFLPQSYPSLTELLYVMKTIPTLQIEIQGHICCQEGTGDGLDIDTGEPFLSYNRARAVYEYLVENGIDRKRMTYKGFGHKYPIIEIETNEQERTTNRRVEIRILKK